MFVKQCSWILKGTVAKTECLTEFYLKSWKMLMYSGNALQ